MTGLSRPCLSTLHLRDDRWSLNQPHYDSVTRKAPYSKFPRFPHGIPRSTVDGVTLYCPRAYSKGCMFNDYVRFLKNLDILIFRVGVYFSKNKLQLTVKQIFVNCFSPNAILDSDDYQIASCYFFEFLPLSQHVDEVITATCEVSFCDRI